MVLEVAQLTDMEFIIYSNAYIYNTSVRIRPT